MRRRSHLMAWRFGILCQNWLFQEQDVQSETGPLELPFKGQRDYLRFADIFPALVDRVQSRFGPGATVDLLTMRRPLKSKIAVSLEAVNVFAGSFRVRNGSECQTGWLVETDQCVDTRVPFDSSILTLHALASAHSAEVLGPVPGLTSFDIVVGLMKVLAYQVEDRHWWLCQMKFFEPLGAAFPLCVKVHRILARQFISFDIHQGGRMAGTARCAVDGAELQGGRGYVSTSRNEAGCRPADNDRSDS